MGKQKENMREEEELAVEVRKYVCLYITKVRHYTKIKEPKNLDLILASLIRKS